MPPKVCIIVPAYNEEGNIKKTVEEILVADATFSVIVVNDGSKDRTQQEALQTSAYVINHPFNLGIGGAVQTGFKFAFAKGFDIAVQVDGDGQHDARFIKSILKPIIDNQADMVIGSRFLPPYTGYQSSFVRRIGINFFARLLSFITQNPVTDPTSGFRAYNRNMIQAFAHYYPHDFPEPEAIAVAKRYNARVLEVPVEMRKRGSGKSSIRYLRTLYYMIKVTFAVLLDKLKHKEKWG